VQYIGAFGDLQRAATPDIYDGTRYLGQVLDSPKELVPGYWVINLGVEKSVPLGLDSPSVAIAVGVNNVLDVSLPRYVPSMIGRQFFCSIAVGW
jgi:outer membrane receptor for Fe3+-dicitrate